MGYLPAIEPERRNRGSAILLDCGRLLVQGAVPYVDYVESHPPLSHYFHALPVLLARWTGIALATPVNGGFSG